MYASMAKHLKKEVKEHRQRFDPDNIQDFIDAFLERESQNINSSVYSGKVMKIGKKVKCFHFSKERCNIIKKNMQLCSKYATVWLKILSNFSSQTVFCLD